MTITKNGFTVKIHGKCETEQDILQLYKFGYSVKGIIKQYAKDNKIKNNEAQKIVIETLYKKAMKDKED